jgi:hypothetical protein
MVTMGWSDLAGSGCGAGGRGGGGPYAGLPPPYIPPGGSGGRRLLLLPGGCSDGLLGLLLGQDGTLVVAVVSGARIRIPNRLSFDLTLEQVQSNKTLTRNCILMLQS